MKITMSTVFSCLLLSLAACTADTSDSSPASQVGEAIHLPTAKWAGTYAAFAGQAYRQLSLTTSARGNGYAIVNANGTQDRGTWSARNIAASKEGIARTEFSLTSESGTKFQASVYQAPYMTDAVRWSEAGKEAVDFKKLVLGPCPDSCDDGTVCSEVTPIYAVMHACVDAGRQLAK
jgi:hypothetical protein